MSGGVLERLLGRVAESRQQARGLAPGGHAQPLAGLADAHVDAGRGNVQLLGDFLGREAASDQGEALALSRRQAGHPFDRR
jgi:hypothetical protein